MYIYAYVYIYKIIGQDVRKGTWLGVSIDVRASLRPAGRRPLPGWHHGQPKLCRPLGRRFAIVTNIEDLKGGRSSSSYGPPEDGDPVSADCEDPTLSRGGLPVSFLTSALSPLDFCRQVAARGDQLSPHRSRVPWWAGLAENLEIYLDHVLDQVNIYIRVCTNALLYAKIKAPAGPPLAPPGPNMYL